MRINQLIQISPSIMCADLCNMEDELRKLESIGVDLLHFDLMDGHFVPNMPLGLVLLEQLRSKTELPFDIHLMVDDNDFISSLGWEEATIEEAWDAGKDKIAKIPTMTQSFFAKLENLTNEYEKFCKFWQVEQDGDCVDAAKEALLKCATLTTSTTILTYYGSANVKKQKACLSEANPKLVTS